MESGRDCWQSGVNPATLVYGIKPDQNWIDDDDEGTFHLYVDRVHFWDFGGHEDYDEIRRELYHQTQVNLHGFKVSQD